MIPRIWQSRIREGAMKRLANCPHLNRQRTKVRERVAGCPLSAWATRTQKIAALEASTGSDSQIPKTPSPSDFLSDIYVWLVKRLGLRAASRLPPYCHTHFRSGNLRVDLSRGIRGRTGGIPSHQVFSPIPASSPSGRVTPRVGRGP